jgi:aspartoacylase
MKIAVYGATHGNEWTGAYLLKDPHFNKYKGVSWHLSNTKANQDHVRFLDDDLNRSFTPEKIQSSDNWEHRRAAQISQDIKENKIDFVIDLHTTTSNMGNTIIFPRMDTTILNVCGKLATLHPDVKFIYTPDEEDHKYLMSAAPYGLIIEIGPVPQNCLNPVVYKDMRSILDSLIQIIQGKNVKISNFDYYEEFATIDYIYQDNELVSMVHPKWQNMDFTPMNSGDPILEKFSGEEVFYKGKETVYPIFINEAAYYVYGKAMGLTYKKRYEF